MSLDTCMYIRISIEAGEQYRKSALAGILVEHAGKTFEKVPEYQLDRHDYLRHAYMLFALQNRQPFGKPYHCPTLVYTSGHGIRHK